MGESGAPSAGDRASLDGFTDALYDELRGLAHRQLLGERAVPTLTTTALVHEAYLKLSRLDRIEWKNRAPLSAEAARATRRIGETHDISAATVKRDWAMARAWLNRHLVG